MSVVLALTALYMLLYIALSLPAVQDVIRSTVETELGDFLGTKIEIGELQISPFKSVVIKDVKVYDRQNVHALEISRLGAGINIWRLLWYQRLDFTYAEILELNADVYQPAADAPLNIQFIIDAFKPKDKNKPPTPFDFTIRHIVIRKSSLAFDKSWSPKKDAAYFDANHIRVYDLNADLSLPSMKNDDFNIDVRRIAFKERSGLVVDGITCKAHVTPTQLDVADFSLRMPGSFLKLPDITLTAPEKYKYLQTLKNESHSLKIADAKITPSDFKCFYPGLSNLKEPLSLDLDVEGDMDYLNLHALKLASSSSSVALSVTGVAENPTSKDHFRVELKEFSLSVNAQQVGNILAMVPGMREDVKGIITRCGSVSVDAPIIISSGDILSDIKIETSLGALALGVDADYDLPSKYFNGDISALSSGFKLGTLLNNAKLGEVALTADASVILKNKDISGELEAEIPFVDFNGERLTAINLNASKNGDSASVDFSIDDNKAVANIQCSYADRDGGKYLSLNSDIETLYLSLINPNGALGRYSVSGKLNADLSGTNPTDIVGDVTAGNIMINRDDEHNLYVGDVAVSSQRVEDTRLLTIDSQFLSGRFSGDFDVMSMVAMVKCSLAKAFPLFIQPNENDKKLYFGSRGTGGHSTEHSAGYADVDVTIHRSNLLTEYFNLPVTMLSDVDIHGRIDRGQNSVIAQINCPYIQQGKNKLIRDSHVNVLLSNNDSTYTVTATTTMPAKNNEITLSMDLRAFENNAAVDLDWLVHREGSFKGRVSLDALLGKSSLSGKPTASVKVLPTTFDVNDTTWYIAPASLDYADKHIRAKGVRVSSGKQFVAIDGEASSSNTDTLKVQLQRMNLDYVFNTLGINYVNFGGIATGDLFTTSVFAPTPLAFTPSLKVEGFTYNGGLLGDADISSYWDNEQKKVAIHSDIMDDGNLAAVIDGGIWVTRDSLSFDLDASKVNIKFLEPFMSAFTSQVSGRASGHACLYGTFHDIDLIGKLKADTINMRVDFTNTSYGGSDSINIYPGEISIKNFKLYDKYGNSAILNGNVRHRYFHEPSFDFNISNARNLLCYNTNATINPIWYGTIFGNGAASITGYPGVVDIMVDMQTAPNSTFTFVLSEQEEAYDYDFLSFTDKRKEAVIKEMPDTVPDIIKQFRKKQEENQLGSSLFNMELRASVTPQAEMVIVMDPIAGDKIKAYGSGSMQMGYTSPEEKLTMYGKYTLDRGTYNFSLQDVILRTFNIREGSSISFNGDPYQASLNIDALYRVNTNLSDLDKSFSTDKDLNRTNVPVDAVLRVNGDMQSPDITFDIELPTLTQDVARKVKSIVSTEDMMSRQIVYLLALNRFYTPEYMGGSGSNNELASIASTTLSSHLSNILGQISDKWSFSPYFRTDHGDFSDMEVDLALSSRLLNNRLLINGNFGYRDRTTSNTTFIGDFDLEYLLNKRGSFRLKAYNHYNDQNYYLKTALTTQGIGVVYKHDFSRWFNFLRKRRKKD